MFTAEVIGSIGAFLNVVIIFMLQTFEKRLSRLEQAHFENGCRALQELSRQINGD